jgi:hypothetical protein
MASENVEVVAVKKRVHARRLDDELGCVNSRHSRMEFSIQFAAKSVFIRAHPWLKFCRPE